MHHLRFDSSIQLRVKYLSCKEFQGKFQTDQTYQKACLLYYRKSAGCVEYIHYSNGQDFPYDPSTPLHIMIPGLGSSPQSNNFGLVRLSRINPPRGLLYEPPERALSNECCGVYCCLRGCL